MVDTLFKDFLLIALHSATIFQYHFVYISYIYYYKKDERKILEINIIYDKEITNRTEYLIISIQ